MKTPDPCPNALLNQADLDAELGAAEAAEAQRHRADCGSCQEAERDLVRLRGLLRGPALYRRAPAGLRQRVLALSAPPAAATRWWRHPLFNLGLGAAAATILLLALHGPAPIRPLEQIVDDHVRSLQPGHLQDIASSDRHTIKPWFQGRLDFSPPVKDLAGQGFPLTGARLDYLGGRPVAVLVYSHGGHRINLFVWPSPQTPDREAQTYRRLGYNLIHWVQGGMTQWAVGDLEPGLLADFVRSWRAAP